MQAKEETSSSPHPRVTAVNSFFTKHVYSPLTDVVMTPISFYLDPEIPLIPKVALGIVFAPILIPAFVATLKLAFCIAVIAAVIHGICLIGAGLKDFGDTLAPVREAYGPKGNL